MQYKFEELSIEILNKCVGRCLHCSSCSGVYEEGRLPYDVVRRLITEAKMIGGEVISLSGGDPLCDERWRDYVGLITSLGMKCLFYTCGFRAVDDKPYPIADDDIRFLGECGATVIYSVEGARAETHNRIFGWDVYEQIVDIIKKTIDEGLAVEVHFTPNKLNLGEIPKFLEQINEWGISKASFLRIVPQGRAYQNWDILSLSPKEFLWMQKLFCSYDGAVPIRLGCPIDFTHLVNDGYKKKCHAGLDMLLVRYDGDVHACAGWKNCDKLILGNIYRNTLKYIWEKSENLAELRSYHNNRASFKGRCRHCVKLRACGGGCLAQRISLNKFIGYFDVKEQMYNMHDPLCPLANGLV